MRSARGSIDHFERRERITAPRSDGRGAVFVCFAQIGAFCFVNCAH